MVAAIHRPSSVEEALRLLAATEGARPLAGGATLVAMMNANLAEPRALVSLGAIAELKELRRLSDGTVRIGAMRRHRETAHESDLRDGQMLLALAARQISNATVRNMGTIGGSIAFADPAADYATAIVAADARIEIAGSAGRREVAAGDFFEGWYETALAPGEIVAAVLVPPGPPGAIAHYEKLARVAGDYAIASVGAIAAFDGARLSFLRLAVGACAPAPVRVAEAEDLLVREGMSEAVIARAGALIEARLDPFDDTRASAAYRRKVVPRLIAKSLATLAGRARAGKAA